MLLENGKKYDVSMTLWNYCKDPSLQIESFAIVNLYRQNCGYTMPTYKFKEFKNDPHKVQNIFCIILYYAAFWLMAH